MPDGGAEQVVDSLRVPGSLTTYVPGPGLSHSSSASLERLLDDLPAAASASPGHPCARLSHGLIVACDGACSCIAAV